MVDSVAVPFSIPDLRSAVTANITLYDVPFSVLKDGTQFQNFTIFLLIIIWGK